jgi:hypothetical protein
VVNEIEEPPADKAADTKEPRQPREPKAKKPSKEPPPEPADDRTAPEKRKKNDRPRRP